ncbi:hypothetical protein [Pedobacter hartonius]|uniref:DUF3037 domain-containing protein n=1 Tax=Pedobacter hartonius TaxID=425514 RepID=A0A1H4HFS3_9SPHI|nr:hypothetical protein [Pedobacter hartonius]SEB20664.1 hypothetical protein SAMN05443550_11723 [Pedobacter hartonius]
MKTFYSILYCTIRPNVGERVSIGLFVGNESTCKFEFSAHKLSVIKGLFSESAFSMIKISLKALQKLSQESKGDILETYKGTSTLKEHYFNYLATYANNLITYSTPKRIDLDLNQNIFDKLFEKFIYQLPSLDEPQLKPIDRVKKQLTSSLAGRVNFDAEIDNSKIPGLVVPAKVWFIGKNEVQVTGEVKDFNGQRPHIIQQQISAHLYLIDRIKETPTGKNGHFFLIGDEPHKDFIENHKLWRAVKESSILDLVPTSEVDKIELYMEEHGVEPLIKISNPGLNPSGLF